MAWDELDLSDRTNIWWLPDGSFAQVIEPPPRGVLPGSFNPLHSGHRELRSAAERWLKGPVYYELSITNADKPPLDATEIQRRASQFEHPLWLTDAPTFAKKAELLPNAAFIVGADTAARIVLPRFYGGRESALREALEGIRELGCWFLVAGRFYEGRFLTASDIPIPQGFEDLFKPLPESEFRIDLSSTDLRPLG